MLLSNIKNGIFNKRMLLSVILGFLCLVFGGYEVFFGYNEGIDFTYLFFFAFSCGTSSILSLIYPVFACALYSDIYAVERSSGYLLYQRTKKKSYIYIFSRIISCGLSGGIAISVPVAGYLAFCMLRKGTALVGIGIDYISYRTVFYQQNPVAYCLGYIGNAFVCGVIFACIGLAISAFVKNTYVILFLPLVIYLLLNILFSGNLFQLNPTLWWDMNLYSDVNAYIVLGNKIFILLLSVFLFSIGVIRNEKD